MHSNKPYVLGYLINCVFSNVFLSKYLYIAYIFVMHDLWMNIKIIPYYFFAGCTRKRAD